MGADRPDGGRISGFEMTFSDGTDQGSALTELQLSLPGDAVLSTPTPGSGPTGYCEVVTGTSTDLGQELTSVRLSTSSGSMTDSAGNFTIMLTTPADFATSYDPTNVGGAFVYAVTPEEGHPCNTGVS